jgi:hypothetical protein
MAPIAPQSGLGYLWAEGTAKIIAQQKCGYILMVASPQREAAVPIVTPSPPMTPGGRGRLLSRPPHPPFGSEIHLQVCKWLFRDQISAEVTIRVRTSAAIMCFGVAMFKETHPILGTRDI